MSELLRFAPEGWVRDASVRVRWIAEAQWGVIARWQLFDCGVSSGTISRWIERGWLIRVHPGVYALGHTNLPIEGRMVAALLYSGKGSGLSHALGVWWFGLIPEQPETLSVSAPGRRSSLPGVDVHHPRTLELTSHRRFPITPVERALLDYSATATLGDVRMALSEADYRDLLHIEKIKTTCGRGHAGSARLREALASHEPRLAHTRSRLERKFVALCKRYRIPLPDVNQKLSWMTVDAIWWDRRVVVELDGYRGHRSRARLERDRRREMRCRELGYLVVRYTEDQIDHEPERVAADVARALGLSLIALSA
jgi:very-short-patch-repair endonuclease